MSDPTLNLELPLDKGTVYTRTDGRSAEIISVERHTKTREAIGVNVRITQDGHEPVHALIRMSDLLSWQLRKPELAPQSNLTPATDDSPVATVIADLHEQIAQLRDRNAKLEARNAELNSEVEQLHGLTALSAHMDDKDIARLTEQLAEARAELASLKTSPIAAASAAEPLTSWQEVCVIRNITQQQFTDKLTAHWMPIHVQFIESRDEKYEDRLNVVFTKTITAPVDYSARRAVTPIGKMVTIIPEARPQRQPFNAEEHMEGVLNECFQAAKDAVADQMPLYETILNRPAFVLGVGTPAKPEVR